MSNLTQFRFLINLLETEESPERITAILELVLETLSLDDLYTLKIEVESDSPFNEKLRNTDICNDIVLLYSKKLHEAPFNESHYLAQAFAARLANNGPWEDSSILSYDTTAVVAQGLLGKQPEAVIEYCLSLKRAGVPHSFIAAALTWSVAPELQTDVFAELPLHVMLTLFDNLKGFRRVFSDEELLTLASAENSEDANILPSAFGFLPPLGSTSAGADRELLFILGNSDNREMIDVWMNNTLRTGLKLTYVRRVLGYSDFRPTSDLRDLTRLRITLTQALPFSPTFSSKIEWSDEDYHTTCEALRELLSLTSSKGQQSSDQASDLLSDAIAELKRYQLSSKHLHGLIDVLEPSSQSHLASSLAPLATLDQTTLVRVLKAASFSILPRPVLEREDIEDLVELLPWSIVVASLQNPGTPALTRLIWSKLSDKVRDPATVQALLDLSDFTGTVSELLGVFAYMTGNRTPQNA